MTRCLIEVQYVMHVHGMTHYASHLYIEYKEGIWMSFPQDSDWFVEVLDFRFGVLLICLACTLVNCLVFVAVNTLQERQARAGCLHHEAQGGL